MSRGPQASITPPGGAVAIAAGASIQSAITANPAGTTFALGVGTHTISASITPKTGNTFVGNYGAVLDGTGWAFTGDLNVGAFRAHNQDIDNVTIRNLTIQNMPMRAVHAFNGPNGWVIEDCDLLYNRNAIRVAADSTVRRCRILHNTGDDTNPNPNLQGGGYGCYQAANCTFDDNEIAFNGPEQKFFESTNTTFTNNYFHDGDKGIWLDGCDGGICSGNTIEDLRIGIEFEISRNGTLHHNTIRRCTGWGIFISCSFNTDTYENRIEDCFKGIQYFLDCSRAGTTTGLGFIHDLKDNDTYDNLIRIPTTANATGTSLVLYSVTCDATAIALYTGGTKNLTFERNRYAAPTLTTSNWSWGTTNKTWTQWQALGNDETGVLGLSVNPGTTIQTVVTANAVGTQFWLMPGTHVLQSVIPKSGNTFAAFAPGVILDGQNTTQYAFYANSLAQTNVTIRGLEIKNYNPPTQYGAITGDTGIGWLIENNNVHDNSFSGIRVGVSTIVRGNVIYRNGVIGLSGFQAHGTLVEHNELYLNNFSQAPEEPVLASAAGMKFGETGTTTVRHNYVHHNYAKGIWFDHCHAGNLITDNRSTDNMSDGIMVEISCQCLVSYNTILRNAIGQGFPAGGIKVINSRDVEVAHNIIQGNERGIVANCSDATLTWSCGILRVENLNVHDNTIRLATGYTGVATTGGYTDVYSVWNNHFENNRYSVSNLSGLYWFWNGGLVNWTTWQAAGHDDTGSLILISAEPAIPVGGAATMSKGQTFQIDILKLIFWGTQIPNLADNAASSPLTSLYLALHTADPGETGDQTTNETGYTGYVRQPIVRSSSGWAITGSSVSPTSNIAFPVCTAGTSAVTHVSLGTALTGTGKVLYKGLLTPNIAVALGVIPRLLSTSTITED